MTSALATVDSAPAAVSLGTLQATDAGSLIVGATAIAKPLAAVIEDRKLYKQIGGNRYVRCEGWTTLAAMLGCTPHEVSVTEHEGLYTAIVEMRRLSDGRAVSRASAECGGSQDGDWVTRPPNARRSMALTRATGKSCRLAFSWIIVLAGFDATPYEEMEMDGLDAPSQANSHRPSVPPIAPPPPAVAALEPLYHVKDIETTTGTSKAGKPYTRYTIVFSDGTGASTLSEKIKALAEKAYAEGFAVRRALKKTPYGTDVEELARG